MKLVRQKRAIPAYVTKRIVLNSSKRAIIVASGKAMDTLGYVITVENGWLVKKSNEGRVWKLKKLAPKVKAKEVILD